MKKLVKKIFNRMWIILSLLILLAILLKGSVAIFSNTPVWSISTINLSCLIVTTIALACLIMLPLVKKRKRKQSKQK